MNTTIYNKDEEEEDHGMEIQSSWNNETTLQKNLTRGDGDHGI